MGNLTLKTNIMKFIKLTVKHNLQHIEDMVTKLDKSYIEKMNELYDSFKCVEFTTVEGLEVMYAVVDDFIIEKLFKEYMNCEISFSYEDITKSVLFGQIPEISREEEKHLDYLISEFIDENLELDIVLDKINECGISSLTDKDRRILEIV